MTLREIFQQLQNVRTIEINLDGDIYEYESWSFTDSKLSKVALEEAKYVKFSNDGPLFSLNELVWEEDWEEEGKIKFITEDYVVELCFS